MHKLIISSRIFSLKRKNDPMLLINHMEIIIKCRIEMVSIGKELLICVKSGIFLGFWLVFS